MPFFNKLPWKMSAKLGPTMARIPKTRNAPTACSRHDPHPKGSRHSMICAPAYLTWFNANVGFGDRAELSCPGDTAVEVASFVEQIDAEAGTPNGLHELL